MLAGLWRNFAAFAYLASALPAAAQAPLTIDGATIIDGNGGAPISGPLVIQGNRIISAGSTAQASNPQAYCINANAEFYPYAGDPCSTGYQLGTHNCRLPSGELHLVSRVDCQNMGGLVALPAPAVPAGSLIRQTAPQNR
jgi:hypothetical protein